MAVPGAGARASGRLSLLSTLSVFAFSLPIVNGFQITSVGTFAQCVPTVITWDIGQSLPPFNISLGIASSSTDDPLLFSGFEGSSATVTFNLPAKTLVNLALVNIGGVLDQVLNLAVQPGTDSSCTNTASSGTVAVVASISSLSAFPAAGTSDSSTSTDTSSSPTIISSAPSQFPSIGHSSFSITGTTSAVSEQSDSAASTSSSISIRHPSRPLHPSQTLLTIKSTSTANPFVLPSDSFSPSIPRPTIVIPLSPSLSSQTSGKGLKPDVIGAIVACSIVSLALCLWLLFWCKQRWQRQREMDHTRLGSPEPREFSIRDSISVVSVQHLRLPSLGMPNPNSPTSVNATISLPTAEAIMEHRNKPLPTPHTPSSKARASPASANSAGLGASSSQEPMSSPRVLNSASTSTPSTALTVFWNSRRFARRTQESARMAGSRSGGSVFDDASSDVPSTAPPPYDQYD